MTLNEQCELVADRRLDAMTKIFGKQISTHEIEDCIKQALMAQGYPYSDVVVDPNIDSDGYPHMAVYIESDTCEITGLSRNLRCHFTKAHTIDAPSSLDGGREDRKRRA